MAKIPLLAGPRVVAHQWRGGDRCWRIVFAIRGRERCVFDWTAFNGGTRVRVLGITLLNTVRA